VLRYGPRDAAESHIASAPFVDAGIDEELVALLGQHAPLPVTYAGGARTLVRCDPTLQQHMAACDRKANTAVLRCDSEAKTVFYRSAACCLPRAVSAGREVRVATPACGTLQEDLEWVDEAGRGRVDITVGSALDIFGGQLPYEEVVAWHRRNER
jgi:hypothetical protein